MKKMKAVIMTLLAMAVCATIVQATTPDQKYFDQRFDQLEKGVAEVKGDTSQIVEILGNVFEGTVPSGGTLTGLCNDNGWNLIVLMGHNGIKNPNKVAADTKFTYPKTAEEFQSALKKGRPLYRAWLKKQPKTFRVDRIKVDTIEIDKLNIRVAAVTEKLTVKSMEVDELNVRLMNITENLRVKNAEIENLRVKNAEIDHLRIRLAEIEELRIKEFAIKNALIEKLRIKNLQIDKIKAKPPVVVVKEVVQYRNVSGKVVLKGSCKDNPWHATGIWEDFPEGVNGVEVQHRSDGRYKHKLVHRKSGMIYATECFKSNRRYSLKELGQKWSENFVQANNFGEGDGGSHNTIELGIAK